MQRQKVSSGVGDLDRLLGGLYIGDNVIWYDEAGMLSGVFVENFIQASLEQNKPVVYVSFDRSPKSLIARLGHYVENENLIIVDCFTNGKGEKADIFERFYDNKQNLPCRVARVEILILLRISLKSSLRFIKILLWIHGSSSKLLQACRIYGEEKKRF